MTMRAMAHESAITMSACVVQHPIAAMDRKNKRFGRKQMD